MSWYHPLFVDPNQHWIYCTPFPHLYFARIMSYVLRLTSGKVIFWPEICHGRVWLNVFYFEMIIGNIRQRKCIALDVVLVLSTPKRLEIQRYLSHVTAFRTKKFKPHASVCTTTHRTVTNRFDATQTPTSNEIRNNAISDENYYVQLEPLRQRTCHLETTA